MARPQKATVDYFPHNTSHGKTIFVLQSRFGNDGYAFWFKLLEILGSAENHYIDINDSASWEYLLSYTLVSEVIATEILSLCAKLGAINRELWEKGMIRSDNFISNLEGVYSRRAVNLLSNSELWGLCQQKPRSSTQSKVKESKGEDILVNMAVDEAADLELKTQEDPTKPLKPKVPQCPHTEIINLWHEMLPELPAISTKVEGGKEVYNWQGTRAAHLAARWKESERRQSLDWWRGFFGLIKSSNFLMGKTAGRDSRPFKCTLGWAVNPGNFVKIVENFYR